MTARLLAAAALASCLGCHARAAAKPQIPAELAVPAGHHAAFELLGKGTQVYLCTAATTPEGSPTWTLKEPIAELLDAAGKVVGKHYLGPTWESSDGSIVVGAKKQAVDAPGDAIPWLLVEAKSTSGSGTFSHVTWIQRVATKAGRAPATGCDAAHLEALSAIPYDATYVFYVAANLP